VGREQVGPQVQGGLLGEVGEAAVGVARAGQPEPQFGETERPGQERADHVHGLDTGDGQLAGVAADHPGLNAERHPIQPPSGDQPAGHRRQRGYDGKRQVDEPV
jgi:hypothetical protein